MSSVEVDKHIYVIIFELEDGRLAVACKDGKYILHTDDILKSP
jgi:hypothetical protein